VRYARWETPPEVTLVLRNPSRFGGRVTFSRGLASHAEVAPFST
jgi:hypothetical protein